MGEQCRYGHSQYRNESIWNLQPGQSVEAQVSNNQLILTPISRRYSLDELLAQCDMNAAELSEQDVWG